MTGDPAPGTAGNFAGFGQFGLLLSNAGKITFQATFKTTRPENGLFDYADGKITALVLEGRTAPGTGAGVFAQFRALARNDSGQLVFVAALRGGSARNGVFILDTTGLKTVVLDSQTAPYGTQGETFGTFSEPSIGADGTIAFVDNTGIQSRSVELVRKGIFQGNASSVSLRAAKGGEGVQRLHGNFQTPFALRYPDGTQATIFVAWNELRGKNALLVSRQNTLTRVLQEGDQSVAGGTYSFIGNLIVTSSGRFAFVSNLRDSPSKAGIFVGKII
jgi:hypothetical protein